MFLVFLARDSILCLVCFDLVVCTSARDCLERLLQYDLLYGKHPTLYPTLLTYSLPLSTATNVLVCSE